MEFPVFCKKVNVHKVEKTDHDLFRTLDALDTIAVLAVIVVVAAIAGWYLWSIEWALFKKPLTGAESLIGKTGIVVAPIEGENAGEVNIDGVIWKARLREDVEAPNSKLSIGEAIEVVGYSALTVIVRRTA